MFNQSTHDAVSAIIEAEDLLYRAYRVGAVTWPDYVARRDALDTATGINVTNADAQQAAKQSADTTRQLLKGQEIHV